MRSSCQSIEIVIARSGSWKTSLRFAKASTLACFAVWAFVATGCAGAEPPPFVSKPSKGSGGGAGEGGAQGMAGETGSGGRSNARCDEDEQRECVVFVQQANGVTSCWKGFQYCVNGAWTDCLESPPPDRTLD